MRRKKEEARKEAPYDVIVKVRLCELHKGYFGVNISTYNTPFKNLLVVLEVLKSIRACLDCKLEVSSNE